MEWNWNSEELVPEIDLEMETVAAGLVDICLDCTDGDEALEKMLETVTVAFISGWRRTTEESVVRKKVER